MTERAAQIIYETLKNEGLLSNYKEDVGGKTFMGIAFAYYPVDYINIVKIYEQNGYSEAEDYAITFYHKHFWNELYDSIVDTTLLQRVFDFGVNAGITTAVSLLQKTLNKVYNFGLTVDGVFGELTLAKLNAVSKESKLEELESVLHNEYVMCIAEWYRKRKSFGKFGKGWINRSKRIFNL
ncbi:MAG: glycosyl hydrolase 108 family protein [Melioribacteraceae bacterium]